MSDNLDDLFWPIEEIKEKIKASDAYELKNFLTVNSEWDELEHAKEQYEIKCDEIRGVHREMERLTKIILKHGLDKELELP